MSYTMLDWLKDTYPEAMRKTSWEEDYTYRIRTFGTNRAAILFANDRHPDDQRPLPEIELQPNGDISKAPPQPRIGDKR